ncbi:carbohydrate ABC transporter permease [Prosthecomicrobium pneumaticum]|uniref:Multiple sugar transport system permease protein n=1 Tax=Prosthecomicrobium pneumaticum TaxID=81895 RepID=A0A7W9CU71_9HYPH|nr:sugar ABC transporter permease [Prosthecomicrobium pneumaticum]MBB5751611.1 multiple sugar transport system permease protein [Prosthecomicrobium pneumaticum]
MSTPAGARSAARRSRGRGLVERSAPVVMLAPIIIVLAALTLYPFFANVWYSLHARDLTQPFQTGFNAPRNFEAVIEGGSLLHALSITGQFVVIALIVELVLGGLIALALWQPIRGARLFSTILILPFGLTPVALALAWRLLLNPAGGGLNAILAHLGLPTLDWTASPALALPSLILVDVWQWTPFVTLILLAGLVALPNEPFEAASVEGAGYWRSVFDIALPLLKPLILVVVLFRGIDLFRTFDTFWVITGGGPGNATETLNMLLYRLAFQNLNFGQAAALALVMLVIVILCTQPLMKRLVARKDGR